MSFVKLLKLFVQLFFSVKSVDIIIEDLGPMLFLSVPDYIFTEFCPFLSDIIKAKFSDLADMKRIPSLILRFNKGFDSKFTEGLGL